MQKGLCRKEFEFEIAEALNGGSSVITVPVLLRYVTFLAQNFKIARKSRRISEASLKNTDFLKQDSI